MESRKVLKSGKDGKTRSLSARRSCCVCWCGRGGWWAACRLREEEEEEEGIQSIETAAALAAIQQRERASELEQRQEAFECENIEYISMLLCGILRPVRVVSQSRCGDAEICHIRSLERRGEERSGDNTEQA
jgi:hypothetical protein